MVLNYQTLQICIDLTNSSVSMLRFSVDTLTGYMEFTPRNCFIKKCAGFKGFGFTLHAEVENEKVRGFINKIDAGSPAEQSGLLVGDRLVEVNGVNIEKDSYQQIIERIITSGDEVRLLVVDRETDDYYTGLGMAITAPRAEDRQVDSEPNTPETQRNTLFYANSVCLYNFLYRAVLCFLYTYSRCSRASVNLIK